MSETDFFQGFILREFLLEDQLDDAFNYAAVAAWLGELSGEPPAVAVDHLLTLSIQRFVSAGMTQASIIGLLLPLRIDNIGFLMRSGTEVLDGAKSVEENYALSCRNALCHAVQGSWVFAFGALRVASAVNDDWARHHYLYGLIHGARGDFAHAASELEVAFHAEPFDEPRTRVAEALALARSKL